MKDYFKTKYITEILTTSQILEGNFGLEKEGLRVTIDGKLSLTEHPKIFGNKLENPYITTDFSESQVEIVTPTFDTTKEAYDCLSTLVDIVNINIPDDEYIWNQSLPCILPQDDLIPLAQYEGVIGKKSYEYRKELAKRYGTKKQMISGIHYNFSFKEENIRKLYDNIDENIDYKEFKNNMYLKIVRNYLKYRWLIIYLTGTSVACHKSFTNECIKLMEKTDCNDGYYSEYSTSFRNSKIGYKNLKPLYPNYDNLSSFVDDVEEFINKGDLSEAKELYTQIRLKPKDRDNYLNSLKTDGIQYVELRTVDINPFDKCGISENDMEMIHLFLLFTLLTDDENYPNWQKESLKNEEIVSEFAFDDNKKLIRNNEEISLQKWASETIDKISSINNELNLGKENIIKQMYEKINNPDKTHSKQLIKEVKAEGFINTNIMLAKKYKNDSINNSNNNNKIIDLSKKALNI